MLRNASGRFEAEASGTAAKTVVTEVDNNPMHKLLLQLDARVREVDFVGHHHAGRAKRLAVVGRQQQRDAANIGGKRATQGQGSPHFHMFSSVFAALRETMTESSDNATHAVDRLRAIEDLVNLPTEQTLEDVEAWCKVFPVVNMFDWPNQASATVENMIVAATCQGGTTRTSGKAPRGNLAYKWVQQGSASSAAGSWRAGAPMRRWTGLACRVIPSSVNDAAM